MYISKKDALAWFEFFAQLPAGPSQKKGVIQMPKTHLNSPRRFCLTAKRRHFCPVFAVFDAFLQRHKGKKRKFRASQKPNVGLCSQGLRQ